MHPNKGLKYNITSTTTFFVITLIFWGARIYYWSITNEEPFSDMANFDAVAHGIVSSWSFEWSSFWKTYSTPTLFVLRALDLFLFGEGLLHWRFFQTSLLYLSLLWMASEIMFRVKKPWIALGLLAVVALSKPSIFWSLKLSRESIHEMFTYATIASFLLMMRKRQFLYCALFGFVLMANILNRPNSLFIAPLVCVIYFAVEYKVANGSVGIKLRKTLKATLITSVIMLSGMLVLWGPWMMRSYKIYGEVVPFSTQAAYTVLWDLGRIQVKMEGGEVLITDVNQLQANAYKDFQTDLDASKYANSVAKAWFNENWQEIPLHIQRRLASSVNIEIEYLSKVSRTDLYGNIADKWFLFDKSKTIVVLGAAGLILLPFLYSIELWIVCVSTLVPWLTGAMMVGYPRMLDPSLSLLFFGNVIVAICIVQLLPVFLSFMPKKHIG